MSRAETLRILTRLGLRIVELRTLRGLTQEELAEQVPLSPRQMQRLEAGEANVSLLKLIVIAQLLHCSMTQLFGMPERQIRRKPGRPPGKESGTGAARARTRRQS